MRYLLLFTLLAIPLALRAESPPDLRTRTTGSDWPTFLGPTSNGVSHHRRPHLARHCEPEPGLSVRARCHQTHQRSGRYLRSPFLDLQEVAAFEEADLPGKRLAQPYFLAADTASRLRPLARRRRSTSFPARVLFRFRKPWVRFRFNLDGWYVRFDTGGHSA